MGGKIGTLSYLTATRFLFPPALLFTMLEMLSLELIELEALESLLLFKTDPPNPMLLLLFLLLFRMFAERMTL